MAWWLLVAGAAWAADVCEKARVVETEDPISGERGLRGGVDLDTALKGRDMVQHAWDLLAADGDVVLVVHSLVAGRQEVVVPAAWPLTVHVEGGQPITLRARTLSLPRLVSEEPAVTAFESRFRLDAVTARWFAAHPPWRVAAEWGDVRASYAIKGRGQRQISTLMACAATLAPEELPELRGIIGELAGE
jgi:hypothetical protein